jgi:hypothetical protein
LTALDNGTGYIEDKRPASNIKTSVFGALFADSTLLEKSQAGIMPLHFQQWPSWLAKIAHRLKAIRFNKN